MATNSQKVILVTICIHQSIINQFNRLITPKNTTINRKLSKKQKRIDLKAPIEPLVNQTFDFTKIEII